MYVYIYIYTQIYNIYSKEQRKKKLWFFASDGLTKNTVTFLFGSKLSLQSIKRKNPNMLILISVLVLQHQKKTK